MSAIEHANLRTQAAYVEGPSGRLKIIADFGSQRLAFTEPGTEATWPRQSTRPSWRRTGCPLDARKGSKAGSFTVTPGQPRNTVGLRKSRSAVLGPLPFQTVRRSRFRRAFLVPVPVSAIGTPVAAGQPASRSVTWSA
jgi:hypothetical protein